MAPARDAPRSRRGAAPAALAVSLALGDALLPACSLPPQRPTDADLLAASAAAPRGVQTFATFCAPCHGKRGQGVGEAPPVLGPGALPEFPRDAVPTRNSLYRDLQQMQIDSQTRPVGFPWRAPFRNAEDLVSFLALHLAKAQRGEVRPEDDRAVVTYLLAAQGAALPSEGVTAENARSIPVPHF
ncbi:MAG: hypothetical protein JOZ69_07655 [Myxococcales bacterium]|nr:hypothetical protein [Myxococcales bacterium]